MQVPEGLRGRTYLRVSLTDRCNLRCRYCRPGSGVADPDPSNSTDESELSDLIRLVHETTGIRKLRLSGGEPLLYPNAAGLIAQLRTLLPGVTLGLTTNGTLLARSAERLREAGLDSINVSLDSLDSKRFHSITVNGDLGSTLNGIRAAMEAGFSSIKLNTVLVRRVNGDQLADLVRFANSLECEIRFIELMPFGHGRDLFRSDFLGADEAIESLTRSFEYVSDAPATGTAARHRFLIDGHVATVGFITPISQPFCSRCDRLRLTRTGHLYPCLRQSASIDLITPLRASDEAEVRDRIRGSLCGKTTPGRHWPERQMVTIGG